MVSSEVFSSIHHKFIHREGGDLFAYLCRILPHIPADEWDKRAQFGGLYINGLRVTEDKILPLPACIEYYEPKYSIDQSSMHYPVFSQDWIVYEDLFFIVCCKPAGLSTMPAKEQTKHSLRTYLDSYAGCAVHCPSRLDTSTYGLVIVSKDQRTHGLLGQLFEYKKIKKEYRFITNSKIDWDFFEANEPIGKSNKHPVLRCINGIESKSAFTRFEKICQLNDNGTLIRALPKTGRTHQIRVHSSAHSFAIRGDKFYGSDSSLNKGPLCLLSYSLSFTHPVSEQNLTIELPDRLMPNWLY